jgi:hypothetical protein
MTPRLTKNGGFTAIRRALKICRMFFNDLKNFHAVTAVKANYFILFARFRLRISATRQ